MRVGIGEIGPLPEVKRLEDAILIAENNLGVVAGQAGRLDEAAAHFSRSAELDPDAPQTHRNLGMTYLQLGELEEARAAFEATLRIAPDDAGARQGLDEVLRRIGSRPGMR